MRRSFGELLKRKIEGYESTIQNNKDINKEELEIRLKELKEIYESWEVTEDLRLQRLYPDYYMSEITEEEAKERYYNSLEEHNLN